MPGPEVKNWDQYHALRKKGMTKKQAAMITNAASRKVAKSLKPSAPERLFHVERSAFAIIHKSETEEGKFKPVSQMTAGERDAVRAHSVGRVAAAKSRQIKAKQEARWGGRTHEGGLAQVFGHHGVTMSHQGLAHKVNAPTVKSAMHPNIEYGHGISEEGRKTYDKALDPKLTKTLRHPVVIHRDEIAAPGFLQTIRGAAVGAHKLTRGKGHVVMNSEHFDEHGKPIESTLFGTSDLKKTVNHEVAHAAKKEATSSFQHRPDPQRSSMGEEARADAVGLRGKEGAYEHSFAEKSLTVAPEHEARYREVLGHHRKANHIPTPKHEAPAYPRYRGGEGLDYLARANRATQFVAAAAAGVAGASMLYEDHKKKQLRQQRGRKQPVKKGASSLATEMFHMEQSAFGVVKGLRPDHLTRALRLRLSDNPDTAKRAEALSERVMSGKLKNATKYSGVRGGYTDNRWKK